MLNWLSHKYEFREAGLIISHILIWPLSRIQNSVGCWKIPSLSFWNNHLKQTMFLCLNKMTHRGFEETILVIRFFWEIKIRKSMHVIQYFILYLKSQYICNCLQNFENNLLYYSKAFQIWIDAQNHGKNSEIVVRVFHKICLYSVF